MIPIFEPDLDGNERANLLECIETGWISSQGRFVTAFEQAFADYHGIPYAVSTSSCTTALHLALVAAGIGPGDQVLCPDLTFIAPANMISLCGATPVLIDVEPDSWAIDPRAMSEAITPATRAVIVVHPFGHAADMDPIMEIARAQDLVVIEDNAEAPGGRYKERLLGTIGDFGCFSFFANKIMTTGEGGMVLCHHEDKAETLRMLRDHGMSRQQRYVFDQIGFNYRMTNMQAAIGLAQLERLEEIQKKRNDQAKYYRHRFESSSAAAWRPTLSWCAPVHWLATISLDDPALRDPLIAHLKTRDIDSRPMIYPLHSAKHFQSIFDPNEFAVTNSVSYRSLHLPSATGLDRASIDKVCDDVLEWLARHT